MPQWKSPYHDAWLSVVGVVDDVRYRELRAARLDLYMSHLQADHRVGGLMVRTRGEPAGLADAVREAVWGLDRDQAPPDVLVMDSVVAKARAVPRFATRVLGAFALVAVLLAALGLYGVLSHGVTQRFREIGVRVAMGAQPGDIVRLILSQAGRLVALGLTLGVPVAAGLAGLVASTLFGVPRFDAGAITLALLVLAGSALLAAYVPAARAARVDPSKTLRYE